MTSFDKQGWSHRGRLTAVVVLLAIVVLPRLWAANRAVAPARDAFRYWSAASCLSTFPLSFSIRAIDCQPLYPATLAGIGSVAFSTAPEACWRRAQAWSIVCAAWFYLASYAMGMRLVSPGAAWLGCVLVSLLPRQIRYSVDVLSDNLHAALWMTALALLVWSWDRRARGASVLLAAAGVCAGLAFWTRFEALLLPAAFLLATTIRTVYLRRLPVSAALTRIAAFTVPIALAVGVYWQLRGDFAARHTVHALLRSTNQQERSSSSPSILAMLDDSTSAPATEEPRTLIDRWLLEVSPASSIVPLAGSFARVVWEFFQETRGWLGILFVMGMFVMRQRLRGDTAWLVAASLLFGCTLLLTLVRWKVGFLAGRYWMPFLPICGMIAAAAIVSLAERLRQRTVTGGRSRHWEWAWCAALVATIFGLNASAWLEPLHADRSGHRQAAEWLAAHVAPGQTVFDPSWACGFFAGRSVWHPLASAIPECEYAAIEPALAARPPVHLKEALDYVAREGRVVAEFPKRPGGRQVGVRIVALPLSDRVASKGHGKQ